MAARLALRISVALFGVGLVTGAGGGPPGAASYRYVPHQGYLHLATQVILPLEIANHSLKEVKAFRNSRYGVSLRYEGDWKGWGDVIIFDPELPQVSIDEKHEEVFREIRDTISGLRLMEKEGHYRDVQLTENGSVLRLGPPQDSFTLVSIPVNYFHRTAGDSQGELHRSYVAAGLFRDHFFKIRYTFPDSEDRETRIAMRQQFVLHVAELVSETRVRESVDRLIGKYWRDPLSGDGYQAGQALQRYIEVSDLIYSTIDTSLLPWLDVANYPYGTELMTGYFIGDLGHQLASLRFETKPEMALAGALRVYRELVSKDPAKGLLAEMEKLSQCGDEELAAWVRTRLAQMTSAQPSTQLSQAARQ